MESFPDLSTEAKSSSFREASVLEPGTWRTLIPRSGPASRWDGKSD